MMNCVGDKFEMLVTDSIHFKSITNITKNVANIIILSPISWIGHRHKIINITLSPTSLSLSPASRLNHQPLKIVNKSKSPTLLSPFLFNPAKQFRMIFSSEIKVRLSVVKIPDPSIYNLLVNEFSTQKIEIFGSK